MSELDNPVGLCGRGTLLIPSGVCFQPAQDRAEDSLLDAFIKAAAIAIRESGLPSAVVPVVREVSDNRVDELKGGAS